MPSTRRRVPEGASPPQTPPFARLDIGIGYRIPMGEVVVPRPCESSQRVTHSQTWAMKGSMEQSVRRRACQSSFGFGFGFGFGNPKSHQCFYLRFSLGFGVRGSAPPCGWVAESPPTGDIPESLPLQIQARRNAQSRPPQEKGQPPERSPLMHERPD